MVPCLISAAEWSGSHMLIENIMPDSGFQRQARNAAAARARGQRAVQRHHLQQGPEEGQPLPLLQP